VGFGLVIKARSIGCITDVVATAFVGLSDSARSATYQLTCYRDALPEVVTEKDKRPYYRQLEKRGRYR